MQKSFEIEQEVPEIWGFKRLEMILLRETKKRKKYHCDLVDVNKTRVHLIITADKNKRDWTTME